MALNVERIRKQVQKAIEVAPFSVSFKRRVFKDDGRGGKLATGEILDAFDGICLFDNSGDGAFGLVHSEGGRENKQGDGQSGPYIIAVYNENNQIVEGDYFEYGGSRYEVTKVTNVLALNIYWQVRLQEIKL